MKVRKAIIPAAGLGTRFLPATKAMPKEMLPIVDKPTIQYIVEEAIESGIEDIIIVTGKGKRAIEDHFDSNMELESILARARKFEILQEVRKPSEMVDIHYIRQKEPRGLGHAVWCARKFIGDEPFAVLLGDDIISSPVPCLKQMVEQFEKRMSSIIGVQKVSPQEVQRYGIVDGILLEQGIHLVHDLVEKPSAEAAPSQIAIMGRYILTPQIFDILEKQPPGSGGEIQLTDALAALNAIESVFAYEFKGKRFDVGEKLGFIKTSIEFALEREELRAPLLSYLQQMLEQKTAVQLDPMHRL